jgi:pimeloyl-ACP methyl ester carboxylesterase
MTILQLKQMQAHYLDQGAGAPVLLVHCSSGSHRQWAFLTDELSASHRLLAPDLLGYGQSSPWPDDGAPVADSDLDVVMALVDTAGEPVHLAGHSYGGMLCLEAARIHAERGNGAVKSLFLVEPVMFPLLNDSAHAQDWETISGVARACIDAVAAGEPEKAADAYMGFWLGEEQWQASPDRFRQDVIGTVAKVAHEFRGVFDLKRTGGDFRAVDCPVGLVHGSRSPRPALAVIEILEASLPRAETAEIAGAGHMSPFTHPAEVAALLLDHLDRAGAAGSGN